MTINLNLNEMYKPPPDKVLTPVTTCIKEIHRYTPQKEVDTLLNELALYSNVSEDSIFLSSGSDLLIKEFMFLFSNNRKIIIAEPTFIIINNAAQNADTSLIKVRLQEPDFKLSIEPILDELDKPSLLVFDNPNNPTGNLILSQHEVEKILNHENVILLLDEAYFEFSKDTSIDLIKKYENLAIVRTLSKSFGLAGSGIGYLIAGRPIRKKFQGLEIMLPYPSVIAGINALRNSNYMEKYVKEVENEKKRIIKKLLKLGTTVFPSYANFLLLKTKIKNISELLVKNGILVHDVSTQFGSEYFRVTISSKKENDLFLENLEKIISEN